ncbi:hypothetical protein [Halolamina salifodinae]|uniref:Phosphotransferase system HPr-like phosphotransfer protein n=1 Tax=Halolamina salifodinae TaxID=1202767 RepID=A0A8T4GVT9_9EURY|nr:hypothetical protein [Halolamina salifodinae]MBP1986560.1 phosphotransferase system HPr-like phosphotransfer protein [Halolamina salifodinae]
MNDDTSRRRFIQIAGVGAAGGLAGCSESSESASGESPDGTATGTAVPTTTGTDTATDSATDQEAASSITISGKLTTTSGSAVSSGQVAVLTKGGEPTTTTPDEDGSFSLSVAAGAEHVIQYHQGTEQFPDDDVPDLYAIESVSSESDVGLGTIQLSKGHELEVVAEGPDGTTVTEDAEVFLTHRKGEGVPMYELRKNPVEVTGEITIRAEYDGATKRKTVNVTSPRTVTFSFSSTESSRSVSVSGSLVRAGGEPVSVGRVVAIGGSTSGQAPVADVGSEGGFELEVAAGTEYTFQYTQAKAEYPDDAIPDIYTFGAFSPSSETDIGTVELPKAYHVTISVADASGDGVTDEADIHITPLNDGAGFPNKLPANPIELGGDVAVQASYENSTTRKTVSVTSERTVELDLGGESGSAASVSGNLQGTDGSPITTGEVLALGGSDNLPSSSMGSDGSFSLELASGTEYTLQYVQGAAGYPDDDIPDLYTIDAVTPDGDTDLGEIIVGTGYEITIVAEGADGSDITDDANIRVSHTNNGTSSGFGILKNPIELTGDVTIVAEHDDIRTRKSLTVDSAQTVTLTLDTTATGTESSSNPVLSGRILDSTGSPVTNGEVLAIGGEFSSALLSSDGTFSLELSSGEPYTLQFVQGGRPDDDVPDLFTIGREEIGSDTDLGGIQLGKGYDVTVRVEDSSGNDVTDDATVSVSHMRNDAGSGFELLNDTLELTGDITLSGEYEGESTEKQLTVTSAQTVVLSFG